MTTVITAELSTRTFRKHLLLTKSTLDRPAAEEGSEHSVPLPVDLTESLVYQRRTLWTGIVLSLAWLALLVSSPSFDLSASQYLSTCGDGVLLCAFGIGLRLWATCVIGGRKQHQIVKTGPYAVCRNPLYLGSFLIALSMAAFLQSISFGLVLLAPVAIYRFGVVPVEERLLMSRFGDDFAEYCRSTPRWLPSLRLPRKNRISILAGPGSRVVWWTEFQRCIGWVFLAACAVGTRQLRVAEWWPHLFHLP